MIRQLLLAITLFLYITCQSNNITINTSATPVATLNNQPLPNATFENGTTVVQTPNITVSTSQLNGTNSPNVTVVTTTSTDITNSTNNTNVNTTEITSLINQDLYLNNGTYNKTTPSYIQLANRNDSQCYQKFFPFIGLLSDYEQAVLLNAAFTNLDSDRCFNCTTYSQQLGAGLNVQLSLIANQLSTSKQGVRSSLSCLYNFGFGSGLSNATSQNVTDEILSYLYFQDVSSKCFSTFLNSIGQLMVFRRRFICATLEAIDSMAIKDSDGNYVGFKWTQPEVANLTDAFMAMVECRAQERNSLSQTVVDSVSAFSQDTTCNAQLRNSVFVVNATNVTTSNATVIPTTTPNSTITITVNSSSPLPAGRMRFLQTVDVTAPSSNVTINSGNETNATAGTNATAPTNETAPVTGNTNTTNVIVPPTNATNPTNETNTTNVIVPPTNPTNETNTTNVIVSSPNPTNETNTTTVIVSPTNSTNTSNVNSTTPLTNTTQPLTNATNTTNITVTPSNSTPVVNVTVVPLVTSSSNTNNSVLNNPITTGGILSNLTTKFIFDTTNQPMLITNLLNFNSSENSQYLQLLNVSNNAKAKNTPLFNEFSSKVSNLFSNYEYHCMPEGPIIYLANILNSELLQLEFGNMNCNGTDYILTINNNSTTCEACNQSLLLSSFTFQDTSIIPQSMYAASICLNNQKIIYSNIVDASGVVFQTYKSQSLDLDKTCMDKARTCAGNAANSTNCPKNSLTSNCLSQLNGLCIQSGLYDLVDAMNFGNDYQLTPPQCDFAQLGVSPKSQEFYNSCFIYILNNFLVEGTNLNANSITNLDRTLFTSSKRRMRFLQGNNSTNATSIIVTQDPTANDTIANSVRAINFGSNATSVDGINEGSSINSTSLNAQLPSVKNPPSGGDTSVQGAVNTQAGSYLKFSYFVIALIISFL